MFYAVQHIFVVELDGENSERSTCEEGKREFVPDGSDHVTVNVTFNCKAKHAMGTPDGDRIVVRTRRFHLEDDQWVQE